MLRIQTQAQTERKGGEKGLHVQDNVGVEAEHVIADQEGQEPHHPAIHRAEGGQGVGEG